MSKIRYTKKFDFTTEKLVPTNLRIQKDVYNWFVDMYGVHWRSVARKILRSFMIAEQTHGNDREIYR